MTGEISSERLHEFLRRHSFGFAGKLEKLIARLDPQICFNSAEHRVLFQAKVSAEGQMPLLIIGEKGTVRLEVHAYAAGILIDAYMRPGFSQMTPTQLRGLLSPIMPLQIWAIQRDLQENEGDDAVRTPPFDKRSLSEQQRLFGQGIFEVSMAFILLHELHHLNVDDRGSTILAEKEADRFAARWLCDAANSSGEQSEFQRIWAIIGIAVALLWITIPNVFRGPRQLNSHPQAHDRLFQVLDEVIDGDEDECPMIWFLVQNILLRYMHFAGFELNAGKDFGTSIDPHEAVSALIDRISRRELA